MSVRGFAAYLGVSHRAVSKWEAAGHRLTPRLETQAMLDTALGRATIDALARFELALSVAPALGSAGTSVDIVDSAFPVITQEHPVDSKLMTLIPAGDFLFGATDERRTLGAYLVDVTPVTNEEYARFVAATGHEAPLHWSDGSHPDELANHPVVHVTHADAMAYTSWAGKMLPSTEEWEKAARGTDGKRYPWGDQPTVAKCNVRESGLGQTTPVDRYHSGVSSYGVYDLSGNVWEWCRTETTAGRFVLKGSASTSPFGRAMAAATNDAAASMSDDDTGFRGVAQA